MLIGGPPSGLRAPAWWGAQQPEPEPYVDPEEQAIYSQPTRTDPPGVVLSGAALGSVGLMAPIIHPDQAVIYLAEVLG